MPIRYITASPAIKAAMIRGVETRRPAKSAMLPAMNEAGMNPIIKPNDGRRIYPIPPPPLKTGMPRMPISIYISEESAPYRPSKMIPERITKIVCIVIGRGEAGICIYAPMVISAVKREDADNFDM